MVAHERFDIPGSVHAGALAREAIGERFGEMLSSDEQQKLRSLVSELVNNAVLHGGADGEHHVIFHLAVAPERIRAEICDGGPGLDPDELRERGRGQGGRGFVILDGLASRWGVSTDDGTCVWFEIDRAQQPS
jgi:anti-sigma regulatory factor (Ser/Thr protein kinase)